MLIKPMLERDSKESGLIAMAYTDTLVSRPAANEGASQGDAMVRRLRRQRRLQRSTAPMIGGWTVRMW